MLPDMKWYMENANRGDSTRTDAISPKEKLECNSTVRKYLRQPSHHQGLNSPIQPRDLQKTFFSGFIGDVLHLFPFFALLEYARRFD
jgi:hypothetical protein